MDATWDLASVGVTLAYGGRHQEAARTMTDARALAEASGNPSARAFVHALVGEITSPFDPGTAEDDLRRAVALAEAVGSRLVVGIARLVLATLHARHRDAATALRHYEGVIVEWERAGAWTSQWVTLRTLVDLLSKVGATRDAAVLLGAVTSARTGAPAFGSDQELLRETEQRLRSNLGDAEVERRMDAGRRLGEDEVATFALEATRRAAGMASAGDGSGSAVDDESS